MADTRLPGFYHIVLTTLLVLMISACGGGSGGFAGGISGDPTNPDVPADPGDPGDPGPPPGSNLVITLTDINGIETNSITAVNPGTLSVAVTDQGNLPVPNVIVTVTLIMPAHRESKVDALIEETSKPL